jgi:hypothetical protein
MGFGEWLRADASIEDKLQDELMARQEDPRTAMLYRLCRQLQHQLQAAVNEIARLEVELMKHEPGVSDRHMEMAEGLMAEFGVSESAPSP